MHKGKYKENLSYITTAQYHNQKTWSNQVYSLCELKVIVYYLQETKQKSYARADKIKEKWKRKKLKFERILKTWKWLSAP